MVRWLALGFGLWCLVFCQPAAAQNPMLRWTPRQWTNFVTSLAGEGADTTGFQWGSANLTNWSGVTLFNTNGLAGTNYVNTATNGHVTAAVTNGLATTAYVDTATNGFVTAAVTNGLAGALGYAPQPASANLTNWSGVTLFNTNGLAGTNYVNTATNGFTTTAYVDAATNGFTTTAYVNTATNGFTTTSYVNTATNGFTTTSYVNTATNGFTTTSYVNTATNGFTTTTYVGTATNTAYQSATNYFEGRLKVIQLATPVTNATTSAAKVTGLDLATGTGTFAFQYFVRYQSTYTTNGVKFSVNHSGTVTSFVVQNRYASTGGSAATAAASMAAAAATGNLLESQARRAKSATANIGPTVSVDSANADMLMVIEGLCVVTVGGNLELYHASETATQSRVMDGSVLILTKAL